MARQNPLLVRIPIRNDIHMANHPAQLGEILVQHLVDSVAPIGLVPQEQKVQQYSQKLGYHPEVAQSIITVVPSSRAIMLP